MQAWRKHFGNQKPVREEIPIPSAPSTGFLVKILAAGVCHSDVGLLQLDQKPFANWKDKYTLGHEGCGKIVEIGSEVKDPRFKKGTIISILSVPGCGLQSCRECGPGYPQLCKNVDSYGIGSDGSFAEYVAVDQRAAALVPDGVTPAQAAVATDACLTAYHAVKTTAKLQSTETAVIFGLGGLGFNALQIALAIGARIIVVEKRQEVLDDAAKFGLPKEDIVPVNENVVDFIKRHNIDVDVIVDFVGTNETFTASQHFSRPGARLIQVGLLGPELTIHNSLAVRKKLSILCSYGGVLQDLEDCLDLIAKGALRPQVETGDMNDFPEVLERLHEGKIKSRIALVPKL